MRTLTDLSPVVIVGVVALGLAGARPSALADLAQDAPVYSQVEPGISPDGREIAFSSGGDIWVVPAAGGEAHLLVAHDATDRRPLYSPDGRHLAFVSARTGGGDLYLLTLDTGVLRRLTWDDGPEQLDGWSPDARWIYFSASSHDIAGMNDIYRIPVDGGTPTIVSGERYVNEFGAAAAPDGRRLALSARGIASSQWWRKGSSHIDRSELWLLDLDADGPAAYTQLGDREARQVWPMWGAGGRDLYYVSDRGGAENIWVRPAGPGGTARRLTAFDDGRVLWPSITLDGGTIAFERAFGIWTADTATGQAREVPITRRGAVATPAPERVRRSSELSALALSPDGRKVAVLTRGDVFAADAKDGGEAARVTDTPDPESQPVWAPDSRRLAYAAVREGVQRLCLYDFGTRTESALTTGPGPDLSPVFSPDGRTLAYLRDRRELRVIDLESREDRAVATGTFADTIDDPRPVWSPDGRWIALFSIGTRGFTNVDLVSLDGGPRRPASFLSNTDANTLAWSPDGTFLLFDTRQRTEPGSLARVDLTLRTPRFREDLFRSLFDEPTSPRDPGTPDPGSAAPRTPEPRNPGTPEPVFSNIHQRLSLLPVGLDVAEVVISPDGKTAVLVARAGGQPNLYAWSLDELDPERAVARQLTTTAGAKANPQFTPDGKEVYYLDAGRIRIATVESRQSKALDVTAELTVDFAADRLPVFRQAWTLLADNFFDPGMNGVDWEAARRAYQPRAAVAANADELRRIMSLMIGDLGVSHLGISAGGAVRPEIGRLGLAFDRRDYERDRRFRITDVVPLGPAALTREIAPGEYLVAVDGRAVGPDVNLDRLLAGTIARRVELSIAPTPDGPVKIVPVRPVNQATAKGLLYRQWVERNREHVFKASGGRLGYVHMINMSAGALDQLYVDLDAENHARDGLVIDLRNNSGGFVNGYALDVFARRSYLRMSTRALPEAPARAILGQRALELRTILVTNQHSLSDAEDFTEGYRTLEIGSVVGEPTAGWIIYTWNTTLMDGSTLRLPRMRVKGADGLDMEGRPRPVDVEVSRPLGQASTGSDDQLDAAIRTLLAQLGRAENLAGRD